MAELALAGTIIGLVATGAHLAVKVANFVQAVEDAPESIQDVRSELQAVNNILEQIKTPIENQPDSIPPGTVSDVAKNAKDCTRVFTQLNKLIDRLGRPNSKRQKFLLSSMRTISSPHKALCKRRNCHSVSPSSWLSGTPLWVTSCPVHVDLHLKSATFRSDTATIITLIKTLVVQQETSNTPTHSQEVARSLISNTAASLQMPPILPLPPAAALPIEPESQPPPYDVATVDTTKDAHKTLAQKPTRSLAQQSIHNLVRDRARY
jgi:hypothetical protein